ncbi:MAG: hypothetical protein FWF15_03295 [Oscillospiraceae bacterium]|nr:hypothetical protein [Oscillospiraceae bacterium]
MTTKKITIGKILKYSVYGLIIFVYLFFMVRICTMGDPKSMEEFVWNESGVSAYNSNSDNFIINVVNEKSMNYQYITGDGKFAVSNIHTAKLADANAGQIQFTIRYNNSTIKTLKADYNLEKDPVGEPFIYILYDSNGNIYRNYQYISDRKLLYNYKRIIFDGIDLTADEFHVDIYYCDDVRFTKPPYGSLPVLKADYYFMDEGYNISKTPVTDKRLNVNPVYRIKD